MVAADDAAGEIEVAVAADGDVSLKCVAAPDEPPPPTRRKPAKLVINEVDYDQVGTDANGFVEITNAGGAVADLANVDLVAVNGGDSAEYDRVALTGTLAPGGHLDVAIDSRTARRTGWRYSTARHSSTRSPTRVGSPPPRSAARLKPRRGDRSADGGGGLQHRRGLADPESRRQGHKRRCGGLGLHDHGHERGGERADAVDLHPMGGRLRARPKSFRFPCTSLTAAELYEPCNEDEQAFRHAHAAGRSRVLSSGAGVAGVLAAPTAITGPVSAVGPTSATASGTVNPGGQATSWYFEYGTSTSYGKKTATKSAGSGTANVQVSGALTGLSAGTTYHYRLVATNGAGTARGADGIFATPTAPVAVTGSATSVTVSSATLNGSVDPNGRATTWYFQYGRARATARGPLRGAPAPARRLGACRPPWRTYGRDGSTTTGSSRRAMPARAGARTGHSRPPARPTRSRRLRHPLR